MRLTAKVALTFALLQLAALGLLGFLEVYKYRALQKDVVVSSLAVVLLDIQRATRASLSLGLTLPEAKSLQGQIDRAKQQEPGIATIAVFQLEGGTPTVLFSTDAGQIGQPPPERWVAQGRERGVWKFEETGKLLTGIGIRDSLDRTIGGVVVDYPIARLEAKFDDMLQIFVPLLLLIAAVAMAAAAAGSVWVMRRAERTPLPALKRRLLWLSVVCMVAAGLVLSLRATGEFERALEPEIRAKASVVARSIASKIGHAVSVGVPFDKLVGVEPFLNDYMREHPELSFVEVASTDGQTRYRAGEAHRGQQMVPTRLQVDTAGSATAATAGQPIATVALELGTRADYVQKQMADLAADSLVVVLVSILLAYEILTLIVARFAMTAPAGGGQSGAAAIVDTNAELTSIRVPLFLFVLAEEVSRSFMPLYIREFTGGITWISPEAAVGLPIAIYMLWFAVATPYAGKLAERYGHRPVFAAGVCLSLIGFAWTSFATGLWALLAARSLAAAGYATGTMACQRYIVSRASRDRQASGMAMFMGAIVGAAICGSSIGGVLADRIGFRGVFFVSLALLVIAYLVLRAVDVGGGESGAAKRNLRWQDMLLLLKNHRFVSLMLLGAIPAKISLAGFLFYLTPLMLKQDGLSQSAIGRVVMLYFIIMYFLNKFASWLSDRYRLRASMVAVGGMLIGGGGFAALAWGGETAVVAGIVALGIGTALGNSAMVVLALDYCRGEAKTIGETPTLVLFRVIERTGSMIGPIVGGLLAAAYGYRGSMVGIGAITLSTALLFGLLCLFYARKESK